MTRQAERIIKDLSPQFPEWNSDFRNFLEWQHYGLIGSKKRRVSQVNLE